jgi:hypothetical protein
MEKCIFIGYPEGYKGWLFYNPLTRKMVVSERAEFDERYTWKYQPPKVTEDRENDKPSITDYTPGPAVFEEDLPPAELPAAPIEDH